MDSGHHLELDCRSSFVLHGIHCQDEDAEPMTDVIRETRRAVSPVCMDMSMSMLLNILRCMYGQVHVRGRERVLEIIHGGSDCRLPPLGSSITFLGDFVYGLLTGI